MARIKNAAQTATPDAGRKGMHDGQGFRDVFNCFQYFMEVGFARSWPYENVHRITPLWL